MASGWTKGCKHPKFLSPKPLVLVILSISLLVLFSFLSSRSSSNGSSTRSLSHPLLHPQLPSVHISHFDCFKSSQLYPVIANVVENLKHPFCYSLSDFGTLPDKPHRNILRLLKGKPFRKPDISGTVQELLEDMKGSNGLVVDVGANVGMASFAAAVMGFRVVALEPVLENLQRICDGIWFNRIGDLVTVYEVAASDHFENITLYKLIGRLDNSAVSATGARLAFKSNEEIAIRVRAVPLDELVPAWEPVVLLKIDVQGWEYHVMKGAQKLLSRKKPNAPYLIYEEDEELLKASNSSTKQIRDFLSDMGYLNCIRHGTDAHCTKN